MNTTTPAHGHGTHHSSQLGHGLAPRFRAIDAAEAKLFEHQIEDLQLTRLANAVLSKSLADIVALSEDNPHLVWEWMQAFSAKKREADSAYQLWSSAIAYLATSGTRTTQRTAAE